MRTIFRDYPIVPALLLIFGAIKFEYNGLNWTVSSPGLAGGFAIMVIIAAVMIYKIFKLFNTVQDILVSRGIIVSRIRCKYDLLIPICILAVCIHGHWIGGPFKSDLGSSGYRWELIMGDDHWAIPFIGALVVVVLLFRVVEICHAIVEAPKRNGQTSSVPY